MKLMVILLGVFLAFLLGTKLAWAAFGGGVCDIPAAVPGASTKCTATANGFCLLDTIDIANKKTTGFCVCYSGYSGDKCQTQDTSTTGSTSSSSSSSNTNAISALALAGIGAYLLSQLSSGSGGLTGGGAQQYYGQGIYG